MKGVCLLSSIPMRSEPTDRAEMVNQVIYGETFDILIQEVKWSKIKLHHDNYIGWIDNKQWKIFVGKKQSIKNLHFVSSHFSKKNRQILPAGSIINFIETDNSKTVLQTAKLFLNTPYLWGGRTCMGIDCSGFTQIVFRIHHIFLLRDAYQQASQGKKISLKNIASNDLVFFQNKEGKIIHVGIAIKEKNTLKIIHASGKVRIDKLDEKGIYNEETQMYTHQLHSIKRVMK